MGTMASSALQKRKSLSALKFGKNGPEFLAFFWVSLTTFRVCQQLSALALEHKQVRVTLGSSQELRVTYSALIILHMWQRTNRTLGHGTQDKEYWI